MTISLTICKSWSEIFIHQLDCVILIWNTIWYYHQHGWQNIYLSWKAIPRTTLCNSKNVSVPSGALYNVPLVVAPYWSSMGWSELTCSKMLKLKRWQAHKLTNVQLILDSLNFNLTSMNLRNQFIFLSISSTCSPKLGFLNASVSNFGNMSLSFPANFVLWRKTRRGDNVNRRKIAKWYFSPN